MQLAVLPVSNNVLLRSRYSRESNRLVHALPHRINQQEDQILLKQYFHTEYEINGEFLVRPVI